MLDPKGLYQLASDVPELDGAVLVHALDGFMDAGSAGKGFVDHLLSTLDHRVVAQFDADLLVDYRARRPEMLFVEDHFERYATPELALRLVHDADGTPFLLLTGPEPDAQWERFVAAVIGLIEQLGVRLTIGVHGIPMAVPHTRPLGVTAHATRKSLVTVVNPWRGEIRLPSSAASLLELRLGETDHDAMGFVAHVPHYLAEADYPDASLALVRSIAAATGLRIPIDALTEAAGQTRKLVQEQVEQSDDVGRVVRALENQYDAYVGGSSKGSLLADRTTMPSADEIGAEFERFLADLDADGRRDPDS
ncbi:MAG: proteasome assembly chaperone family protein [Jiangellaceae bacterium]